MLKMLTIAGGATMALVCISPLGFGYTQTDCDAQKKVQTDASGREIAVKMLVDDHGTCVPVPLNSKEAPPLKTSHLPDQHQ